VHVRSLLAGVGIAAVAVAVPLVVVSTASAEPSSTTASSSATSASCPRLALHQEVKQYLAAHPDVATELTQLKQLPQDQRAAARKQYLATHSDVAAQLKTFQQDRRGTWAEVAGAAAAELDKYPAVKTMVEQLGQTPAGQRATVAKQYLADHADAKAQLKQLRTDNRTRLQSCRAGK
jgi:hemophore-related protein